MSTQDTLPEMDALVPKPMTPSKLMELAIEKGDLGMIAQAMDLQIRWDAHEAKVRFDAALEQFRKNKLVIKKTKEVVIATRGGEDMRYWHAELEKAENIVADGLAAVGLTYTWKPVANTEGKPQVSLILRGFGHTEEMGTLIGPPDISGGKNAMQAVGSSTKYLARYVLFYSLGIVPQEPDDDGRAACGGLSEKAIEEYIMAIKDSSSPEEGLKNFQQGWKAADDVNDKQSRDRIRKVWEEKKKFFMAVKHG